MTKKPFMPKMPSSYDPMENLEKDAQARGQLTKHGKSWTTMSRFFEEVDEWALQGDKDYRKHQEQEAAAKVTDEELAMRMALLQDPNMSAYDFAINYQNGHFGHRHRIRSNGIGE